MRKLRQLWTLAALTAAETLRQPVCLLLTMSCVVLTILVPLTTAHNFGEEGRLARDSGLAFHLMFGLFLGGYAACAALTRERESGTAAAVLSKPVDRSVFFAAKFLGITGVVLVFSTSATLATLLAQRVALKYASDTGHLLDGLTAGLAMGSPVIACGVGAWANFRHRRAFQSTAMATLPLLLAVVAVGCGCFTRAGGWAPYHPQLQWQIVPASLLVAMGLAMLGAIALTLAVRLSLVPTVSTCFVILLLGLASDYVFGQSAGHAPLANLLYALTPNWQHFWVADAIAGGGVVSGTYMLRCALYAFLYTSGILCLGIVAFQHAEVS
ncbi:MAG: hypothetical protein HN341_10370 [Verrucomicrobia bacterium]|jgi:hypothetical protein|nr:hypothetical protein [Verrucomicrobiota bacterium]